jgi:hypothetical protein
MPRFDPEATTTQAIALRGVRLAQLVVLIEGFAVISFLIAALLGILPAGTRGAVLVAVTTLAGLAASLIVLAPARAACAVRRAAMGTLFQVGFLAAFWLLATT